MHYETLRVQQQGEVLTVALHRPESRNAICMQMVHELSDLMDQVEDANDISVFVLRGSPDVFTTGIDLRDFAVAQRREVYGLQKWEQLARQLENLNKFTVAAVQGECIGGGFQLLLLCDARIAERRAAFQFNEVKQGFMPGMATFRLAKYVGLGRAKNIVLTGRTVRAEEACEWGILDSVCPQPEFEDLLDDTIAGLLPYHPVTLQMARRLLNECYATSYEDFLGHFLAAQHRAINTDAFGDLVAKAAGMEAERR